MQCGNYIIMLSHMKKVRFRETETLSVPVASKQGCLDMSLTACGLHLCVLRCAT